MSDPTRPHVNKPGTSMGVFRRYIRQVTLPNGQVTLDASDVVSRACFEEWLTTRNPHPTPEKTFQRCLSAHLSGTDGRSPFSAAEEAAILAVIRQKKAWPAFVKTRYANTGKKGFRSCVVSRSAQRTDAHGHASYGYHEKVFLFQRNRQEAEQHTGGAAGDDASAAGSAAPASEASPGSSRKRKAEPPPPTQPRAVKYAYAPLEVPAMPLPNAPYFMPSNVAAAWPLYMGHDPWQPPQPQPPPQPPPQQHPAEATPPNVPAVPAAGAMGQHPALLALHVPRQPGQYMPPPYVAMYGQPPLAAPPPLHLQPMPQHHVQSAPHSPSVPPPPHPLLVNGSRIRSDPESSASPSTSPSVSDA